MVVKFRQEMLFEVTKSQKFKANMIYMSSNWLMLAEVSQELAANVSGCRSTANS